MYLIRKELNLTKKKKKKKNKEHFMMINMGWEVGNLQFQFNN